MIHQGAHALCHRFPAKRRSSPPALSFFGSDQNTLRASGQWCGILRARLLDSTRGRTRMLDRRNFMKTCSGMGLAGTLFPGVLWAEAQAQGAKKISKEMIENAATIADVPISEEYKEMMLESLNDRAKGYEEIYKLHIPNSVDPALVFDPVLPGMKFETERKPMWMSTPNLPAPPSAPKNLED